MRDAKTLSDVNYALSKFCFEKKKPLIVLAQTKTPIHATGLPALAVLEIPGDPLPNDNFDSWARRLITSEPTLRQFLFREEIKPGGLY